jgi:hypothetical protein
LISEECLNCPPGLKIEDYLAASGFIDSAMKDYEPWGAPAGNVAYIRRPDS